MGLCNVIFDQTQKPKEAVQRKWLFSLSSEKRHKFEDHFSFP